MLLFDEREVKTWPIEITPLDDGIIQAAYSEFLAYGFQKASLHKIA